MPEESLDFLPQVNLLTYISDDTTLIYDSSANGGEYAGPCPFCGGTDRFHVRLDRMRWLCRSCNPRWDDAIAYTRKRHNVSFRRACKILRQWLAEQPVATDEAHPFSFPFSARLDGRSPSTFIAQPPIAEWQEHTSQICNDAVFNLLTRSDMFGSFQNARDYLQCRGLDWRTIQSAGLGYLDLGLVGVTIPITMAGQLWAVKVRLLDNPKQKYRMLKGSKQGALYGADNVRGLETIVVCEGEFDALLLHQTCGDICDVVTPGSATMPILDTWLPYFKRAKKVLLCMDNDTVGQTANQHWSHWLVANGLKEIYVITPKNKDITDDYLAGTDLRAWMVSYL